MKPTLLLFFIWTVSIFAQPGDFSGGAINDPVKMDAKIVQVYTAAMLMMIGRVMKGMNSVPDKYIPAALWFFGVLIYCFQTDFTKGNVMDGLLCAGAAIGLNQTAKQLAPESAKEVAVIKAEAVAEAQKPTSP